MEGKGGVHAMRVKAVTKTVVRVTQGAGKRI